MSQEAMLGVAVGCVFGFLVSLYFARQSSKDLEKRTTSLLNRLELVLRGFEAADLVIWNRDKDGRPIGVAHRKLLIARASAGGKLRRQASVTPPEAPDPPSSDEPPQT